MLSKPYITTEIDSVTKVLSSGKLSSFIGSSHKAVRDFLPMISSELYKADLPEKNFFGGEKVREFEAMWSEKINSPYSISVNSATSGLITALLSLPKDERAEVITTPFSFTASCAAISLANYTPVFADIDDTFCLNPDSVKKSITKNTKAVLYVEWCGNAGHLKEIKRLCQEYNLYLIEDSSQAPMNKYENQYIGTIGDIGVFSFNEPKNIMTGEGGVIVTKNPILAERCRLIRNHGESIPNEEDKYLHDIMGYNFRLTEIQAAIGIEQLKKINMLNKIRQENYEYLQDGIKLYCIPQRITNSEFYPYTAAFTVVKNATSIYEKLSNKNIPVSLGIPRLLCDHPCYKNLSKNYLVHARILNTTYLGFFQIGWPNTTKEMNEIVETIRS